MSALSNDPQKIKVGNLLVDVDNPRYDGRTDQRHALATIAEKQGMKLVRLAEDIAEHGTNPSEVLLVTEADNQGDYVVLEGNRRAAALKLALSPALTKSLGLSSALVKRFEGIHKKSGQNLPTAINCSVLSREDARHWIELKHTGENQGVGVIAWDGLATHRFRGASAAARAVEMVRESSFLDPGTREILDGISVTNVERVLNTPEARKLMGIDILNNEIHCLENENVVLARLAILISDIANQYIKVTQLDSKPQRVAYAQQLIGRPTPRPNQKILPPQSVQKAKPTRKRASKSSTTSAGERLSLIPTSLVLNIPKARIDQIYNELRKLNVKDFKNSCAVLLRVFVEMSVTHYAHRHSIVLTTPFQPAFAGWRQGSKEMTLRRKIKTVADYMEAQRILDRDQLRGIRELCNQSQHVISVDSWNAYIHNLHYTPTPTDLKINWDNIQPFIEKMWPK